MTGTERPNARELSRNQTILRFDVILQHDWPIEQCLLHIRVFVFFAGKTKRPCFGLFIHWLIKQLTNTYRNHFSRAYENRSTQTDGYFRRSTDHVDVEISPHQRIPRQSWIRDSTPWVPHSRRRIPVFLVSGTDSLSCIPDYKALQLFSRIPNSTSKNSGSLTWGKTNIIACVQTPPPPLCKNRRRGPFSDFY